MQINFLYTNATYKTNMMKTDIELANIVCQAWNDLNAELLEAYISDDFAYESVWVLETMYGKERYLDYLRGKFNAIKSSGSVVKAKVYYQEVIGKHVVVLNQDGARESAIELFVKDRLIVKMWMRPLSLTLPGVFKSNKPDSKEFVATETQQIKSIDLQDCDIVKEMEELAKRPEEEQPWYMKSMIANNKDVEIAIRCIEQYFEKEFPDINMSWNFQTKQPDYCDLSFSFGCGTFDVLIESHYGNMRFLDISQIDKLIDECKKNNHVACIAALRSETEVSLINPTTDDTIIFNTFIGR